MPARFRKALKEPLPCIQHAYARTLLALGWKYTTPGLLLIVVAKLWTWALHGWETAVLSLENWFFNAGLPVVTVLAAIWTHPGKVEAPYTVCIASASNLTGLVKSSVECRRTGL